MKLAESSNGVKVEGTLSAIFLPLVVSTGTGAIGSLEWHKAIFWWLYHSNEALLAHSIDVHMLFLARTLSGYYLDL